MIRAVVDTNLVVSGILSPGGRPAVVVRSAGSRFQLVWTASLLVECLRALGYPRVVKALAGREAYARGVVAGLVASAVMVSPEILAPVRVVEGDPDDDLLFAVALAGGAGTIVTGDSRVLRVGSFAGIQVLGAAEFLESLAG